MARIYVHYTIKIRSVLEMGYIPIIISCFAIYYAYKIWSDFQAGKSSWRSSSSTERKTRNEMNRYKEIHNLRYEKRE
jgi:hypothetical protein